MMSNEIDMEIFGEGLQYVEVTLDQGETVIAEAGAMMYMEEGIESVAMMGDGSQPNQSMMGKLLSAGKRALSGESIFLSHFTNQATTQRKVAFAGNIPGSIVNLNLSDVGGSLTCQRDAFLCAAKGTELSVAFTKKLGTGFFGGEGFILQHIKGDGEVAMMVGGKIVKKTLDNQTLRVDTGCLVAFSPGIEYDITRAGNMKSMLFGGEGLFLATLSGSGTVWLQSTPASKMAATLLKNVSTGTGNKPVGNIAGFLDKIS